jgi:hypothetical protein
MMVVALDALDSTLFAGWRNILSSSTIIIHHRRAGTGTHVRRQNRTQLFCLGMAPSEVFLPTRPCTGGAIFFRKSESDDIRRKRRKRRKRKKNEEERRNSRTSTCLGEGEPDSHLRGVYWRARPRLLSTV